MWHPEQTWSVLHDERQAALIAPRRERCAHAAAESPRGPREPGASAPAPTRPARIPAVTRPLVAAARMRRALARLVTA